MAKKSSIEKNKRREKLVKQFAGRRARLKAIANDESLSMDERFAARLKLADSSLAIAFRRARRPANCFTSFSRRLFFSIELFLAMVTSGLRV